MGFAGISMTTFCGMGSSLLSNYFSIQQLKFYGTIRLQDHLLHGLLEKFPVQFLVVAMLLKKSLYFDGEVVGFLDAAGLILFGSAFQNQGK